VLTVTGIAFQVTGLEKA